MAAIYHGEPDRDAHLRRGEADPRRVVHGLGHVVDKPYYIRRYLRDRLASGAQDRVGIFSYFEYGHFSSGKFTAVKDTSFPFAFRHGSVLALSAEEHARVKAAYP